ncbi:ABC transporter permease [Rhabdobacter roseus]|uniref:Putative ABC transport system permease protein n=1 Tax=Rhabdobacter roseus TaxID=1655419 RepID=A0A840U176_9BACT|nr:ABC transporter permease [Rhabdobacter roseus]MBB5285619.1 putative ABC transport system permease protein [Rhabdobacter roseus]
MIHNYFKIAFRNLWKSRLFSVINVLGLSVGMTVSILIVQFVLHEWSYDRFHENEERIFRILSWNVEKGKEVSYPGFSSKLAPHLAENNPEIQKYTRIWRDSEVLIRNPDQSTELKAEKSFAFVDSTFFSIFTFNIRQGNPKTFLANPFTLVISKRIAEKYFGDENPLGKKMLYKGEHLFEVTGVMDNPPTNATLQFDFISSVKTFSILNEFAFDFLANFETYLLLDAQGSADKVEKSIAPACKFLQAMNYKEKDMYLLEPLKNLHFGASYTYNNKSNTKLVGIFFWIAASILFLALFNYINLTTARSTARAKEVGVRKTLGVNRLGLVGQFFTESVLVIMVAFLLALSLIGVFRQPFNELLGLEIDLAFLKSLPFIVALVIILMGSTFIAGIYPSLVLSKFAPAKVLKGNFLSKNNGGSLRHIFIVLQFVVSTALVLSSLVIQKQVTYMKEKDPGFNRDQVLNIRLGAMGAKRSQTFKNELFDQYGIQHVSTSDAFFHRGYAGYPYLNPRDKKELTIGQFDVDEDFVQNMGMRWKIELDKNVLPNHEGFYLVINELALKELGLTSSQAIGQELSTDPVGNSIKIAGVLEDFDIGNARSENKPFIVRIHSGKEPKKGFRFLQVRLGPKDDIQQKIALLERLYKKYESERPFEYSFLDEDFNNSFLAEMRMLKMIRIFTTVAIFVACMGLFGLITFTTQARLKEISIRKVLGADVLGVVRLLSVDFVKLVAVAIVIALPIAYYGMDKWLQDFFYRTEISWWIFALVGVVIITLALLTISFQAIRAALMNPVKSLRTE